MLGHGTAEERSRSRRASHSCSHPQKAERREIGQKAQKRQRGSKAAQGEGQEQASVPLLLSPPRGAEEAETRECREAQRPHKEEDRSRQHSSMCRGTAAEMTRALSTWNSWKEEKTEER